MNNIVMSAGINGFDELYKGDIKSQRMYAGNRGFDYKLHTHLDRCEHKPYPNAQLVKKCGCSKIKRMLEAFDDGYDNVLWFDADTFAMPDARDFTKAVDNDGIFLIKNIRDNFDGGIIIAHNDDKCRLFLQTIWDNFGNAVPKEYMRKYECGHLLYYGTGELKDCVNILDNSWMSLSPDIKGDFQHNHNLNMNKSYDELLKVYNA